MGSIRFSTCVLLQIICSAVLSKLLLTWCPVIGAFKMGHTGGLRAGFLVGLLLFLFLKKGENQLITV